MGVDVLAADSILVVPFAATPCDTVVIASVPNPFPPEKLKFPTPPLLIFLSCRVGKRVLVKEHVTVLPGAVAAALRLTEPAPRFGVAVPDPRPEQLMAVTA